MSADVGNGITPTLKRAYLFLKDEAWDKAIEYCEKALDTDPENAKAYVGRLLAELKISTEEELVDSQVQFSQIDSYLKAIQFSDENYRKILLDLNCENIYRLAIKSYNNAQTEDDYRCAYSLFVSISGYKDSDDLEKECIKRAEAAQLYAIYQNGLSSYNRDSIEDYRSAIRIFANIPDYKDVRELIAKAYIRIEEITKIDQRTKKKIIIIISIISVVVIALFSWWCAATTNVNNERAAIIMSNMAGKTMTQTKIDASDYFSGLVGYRSVYEYTYAFKPDGILDRTIGYELSWTNKAKEYGSKDIESTETSEETYSIGVSLFGNVTIRLGNSSHTLVVDENNKPISMIINGMVYD